MYTVYICMYVSIIYVSICMYVYCLYICMYVCILPIPISVCMHICVYVCMYVRPHIAMGTYVSRYFCNRIRSVAVVTVAAAVGVWYGRAYVLGGRWQGTQGCRPLGPDVTITGSLSMGSVQWADLNLYTCVYASCK